MNHFGQRIRSERRRRGWSQEELAHRAGLAVRTVCRAEQQTRERVYVDTAQRLAAAFGLPLAVLLGEDAAPDGRWVSGGEGWRQVRAEIEALRSCA